MPRKKKSSSKKKTTRKKEAVKKEKRSIQPETRRKIFSIAFLILGLLFLLGPFGIAGVAGDTLFELNYTFLGAGFITLPITLLVIAITRLRNTKTPFDLIETISALFFLIGILGFLYLLSPSKGYGGLVGQFVAGPLERLVGPVMSYVLTLGIAVIALLVIFDLKGVSAQKFNLFKKRESSEGSDSESETLSEKFETITIKNPLKRQTDVPQETVQSEEKRQAKDYAIVGMESHKDKKKEKSEDEIEMNTDAPFTADYQLPPTSILSKSKGKPDFGDIKESANIIQRTLQNFRISVEIDEVSISPTVTRFAVKPAEGVKLSRIVGLRNELGLALAAHPIRIEAPIPGKSLVGIEVPNKKRTTLSLRQLLEEDAFTKAKEPLLVGLGKGVSNLTYMCNIAKMPHMMIAGATGSGKSVTAHNIIVSLLYRNSPEDLRLIMVDPKRVELTLYNDIPHLLTPVIKAPKKAILALRWAAKEMDRRYNVLESEAVRDIGSYHKNIVDPAYAKYKDGVVPTSEEEATLPEKMPYIVVIIDELADIMQAYPKELEASIVRLAQMSRAVGIHLILSTQRPDVNVITGLIKANVPGRIALRVASQIDSRTILDTSGAETLLGAGDMLYRAGNTPTAVRAQSAYISEDEVKKVVKFIKDNYTGGITNDEISLDEQSLGGADAMFSSSIGGGGDNDDDDPLYEDARMAVVEAGKASTSYIQRKLRVGYARAARLMDMLEDRGIIGPANGSKPREILQSMSAEASAFGVDEYGSVPTVDTPLHDASYAEDDEY